jgi:Raf kinase inhibitor-like YbhB/YbcL family protein
MGFSLTSPAFAEGERIPKQYTCDGDNESPPLSWSGAPKGAVEFALICNDPDAPSGNWIHWVLYGVPADVTALPTGVPNAETVIDLGGAKQGRNTAEGIGYTGPCPPKGPEHHYHFRIYALDVKLDLGPGATEGELRDAMEGHMLGEAGLIGLYGR